VLWAGSRFARGEYNGGERSVESTEKLIDTQNKVAVTLWCLGPCFKTHVTQLGDSVLALWSSSAPSSPPAKTVAPLSSTDMFMASSAAWRLPLPSLCHPVLAIPILASRGEAEDGGDDGEKKWSSACPLPSFPLNRCRPFLDGQEADERRKDACRHGLKGIARFLFRIIARNLFGRGTDKTGSCGRSVQKWHVPLTIADGIIPGDSGRLEGDSRGSCC
jgi:hypothetical protein